MKMQIGLLAELVILLLVVEPTQAQSPVDDQLVKAMQAMKRTFTECTNQKFFECISNVKKDGYGLTGRVVRQVNGGTESTDVTVSGKITPADAQNSFMIESKSFSTFPAKTTPTPQFWRTETFDATPGQKDSGVLAAALGSDPSSTNGGAGGVMVCGNLTARFSMLLFTPFGGSVGGQGDKALVDLTQTRLKGLMQQFGQAISVAGACGAAKPKPLQLVPLGDVAPSVRNDADPFTVYVGDKVKVTGVVYSTEGTDGMLLKNPQNVSTIVEISQGVGANVQRVKTDAQGYYEAEYTVLDDRVSVVSVKAVSSDPNRYADGERLYAIDLKKHGSLTVTVATDKAAYAPGEAVTVSGTVSIDGKPAGAIVGFRSDIFPLQSVTADGGNFKYTFTPGQEPQRNVVGAFKNGLHAITAQAILLGYDTGSASAAYLVEQSLVCDSLSAQVVNVSGIARIAPIDPSSMQVGGEAVTGNVLLQTNVNANTKLTQGVKVETKAGARIGIRFEGEQGASASVAINDSTTVQIVTFCKDKATGRIKAVLVIDGSGQVVINKTSGGSAFSNLDLAVVSKAARVTSVLTRYFVGVDNQGATTVAALEGTVQVSAPDGTSAIELPQANRISVTLNTKPDRSQIVPSDGKIDPRLEGMFSQVSSPSPASSKSLNPVPPLNPMILLGAAGAMGVLIFGALIGLLVVVRERGRSRTVSAQVTIRALPRPSDLPESQNALSPLQGSDVFKKAEDKYFVLIGRLSAGRITQEQFQAALRDLMIRDAKGRYWMLGVESGKWFVHEGQTWVEAKPY